MDFISAFEAVFVRRDAFMLLEAADEGGIVVIAYTHADLLDGHIRGMEQLLGLTDAQIDQVFQKALAGLLFKVAADV